MNYAAKLVFASCLVSLVACGEATTTESTPIASLENRDAEIAAEVESALRNASDLPSGLAVEIDDGKVLISGSLQCANCGGMRTPGNTGTIQQSLGAVVRAVPGVSNVEFDLDYSL